MRVAYYLIRMVLAVVVRPMAWVPAARYGWRLRTTWRRLWLPTAKYVRFRLTTAYGTDGWYFDGDEFVGFVRWAAGFGRVG